LKDLATEENEGAQRKQLDLLTTTCPIGSLLFVERTQLIAISYLEHQQRRERFRYARAAHLDQRSN